MKINYLGHRAILLAILAALVALTPCSAPAQDIVGDWQGSLKAGPAELRFVLHIARNSDGSLKGSLDSIDQKSYSIPITSIRLNRESLTFDVASIGGSYEGKRDFQGTAISGTWTQRNAFPLDFKRATAPLIIPERHLDIDPIQVVNFKEGDEAVIPGVPIDAGDDWLKNLSITIKNVSKKDITRIEVQLLFLDTGDGTAGHPYTISQIELGQRPPQALYTRSGDKIPQTPGPPLLVQPSQELTISLTSHFDDIKAEVETRQPISTIRWCRLMYNVYFADGTKWMPDWYYRPDPAHTGSYVPISLQELTEYSGSN